ncbi:Polyisoprenoid-binding protein YceI [Mariprofundus ferrinatatus]|uniref:Polyisoprenoid-binding protein YceI n=1 Tax=Mariprofundus ferrinatatus TaxID=1921087 RepID=A0A2K8L5P3_9PROT|nr:YceI family protein [Mariprofundus ferrinatatus]ATX82607.1 Polyisoprenoid-binding protein YceI [Mariprofundus ferrinatatus]
MKLKYLFAPLLLLLAFIMPAQAAENYAFDIKGQHAFIQFKIKHLGYSWLIGNFNTFNGSYSYDETNPANNSVTAEIDVASIDSNHAERDKHLRSADFFDVAKFPKATFTSTAYEDKGNGKGVLKGNFTLRGVTKEIAFDVTQIGAGKDPWGGFRRGFSGTTTLHLSDYNMLKGGMLGAAAENVELFFSIEGVRQ